MAERNAHVILFYLLSPHESPRYHYISSIEFLKPSSLQIIEFGSPTHDIKTNPNQDVLDLGRALKLVSIHSWKYC